MQEWNMGLAAVAVVNSNPSSWKVEFDNSGIVNNN